MQPLRVVYKDEDGDKIQEVRITTVEGLVTVLLNADFGVWIEGLGEPMCHNDVLVRKSMGKFLRDVLLAPKVEQHNKAHAKAMQAAFVRE